ncbi:MAG: phosphotransferase, partial [Chloroflexota bacterium]
MAVWFKASGPGPAHEGRLLEIFRGHDVPYVALPLAVHPERPWLLFDDGGPTLRATRPDGTGDHDIDAWERILAEYAVLQRSVESTAVRDEMLLGGVPDQRAGRLGGELARLLDDDAIWARITPEERVAADRARADLREATGVIAAAIAELDAGGVAASIQHDDFHGGNILVGPDGD